MSVSDDKLFRARHSLAHLLAQAVLELRPGSRLGFGPPIESGFYYDFVLQAPLSEKDFPELEARMRRLIDEGAAFRREDLPLEEAFQRLEQMGEAYKAEYARELARKQNESSLSFYRSGSFVDMCEGPHVEKASDLPRDGFKLRSLAGAYWRGDERNVMMTRIYAWAFESREALERKIAEHEAWLARDHKKLGRELELFAFDDEVGPGLPLWLPNGAVVRDELERFMRELEFKAGYQRVVTPHLARKSLYLKTGHLPYFEQDMFPELRLDESSSYYLRPMNCPHHHKIFAHGKRSYQDLPLRLAEYGQVYRYENSGALQGLLRVRAICQNDAHIYVSKEQIADELDRVLDLYKRAYAALGLSEYRFRLSKWASGESGKSDKYAGDSEAWSWAEGCLREALQRNGLSFFEAEGEATFYGPKIDIQMRVGPEREETASTIQLDFVSAGRLELAYIGADGKAHRPYIIHRAPLGSHERFTALLIERYGGAFPSWLAPVQVKVATVAEPYSASARQAVESLRDVFLRADLDDSSDRLPKKIRNAAEKKVPYLLVIGEREAQDGSVAVRKRGSNATVSLPLAEFRERLLAEVRARSLELAVI